VQHGWLVAIETSEQSVNLIQYLQSESQTNERERDREREKEREQERLRERERESKREREREQLLEGHCVTSTALWGINALKREERSANAG
jgi:hypothetical protein